MLILGFLGISNLLLVVFAVVIVGIATWSRTWGRNPVGATSWIDGWLKAAVLTALAVLLVAYLPSVVLQTSTVANFSQPVQDLIGTSVWAVGLLVTLGGLHHLRRARRV